MDILIAIFALSVLTAMIVWMMGDIRDALHEAEVDALWEDDTQSVGIFDPYDARPYYDGTRKPPAGEDSTPDKERTGS